MTDAAELARENAALRRRIEELERIGEKNASDAEFLRSVLGAVPAFIVHADCELRIRYINRYQPGLGPEQVIGRSIYDFMAPTDHALGATSIAKARATNEVVRYSNVGVGAHGQPAHYDTYLAPVREADGTVGICLVALDVTPQRLLEEQLRQSQKLEAIGSLTAGIAHNFNNMLTVILPTLDIASRLVPPERLPLLKDASHAAKRAAEMVQQLMTYAGQSFSHERRPVALDDVVEASVGICRRVFDRRVQIETTYGGPAPVVVCSPVQLEQVLVNLLLNARDAVLEAGPGRGLVSIRVQPASAPPNDPHGATEPSVAIEVEDDGIGMTDETRLHIFEPFFTTKGSGRGTGLGLATSFAIVRDHQGTLLCRSQPGRGTTFTINLPVSAEAPQPSERPPRAHSSKVLSVLLVDDDALVRATVEHVLSDAGMRVIAAADGAAGVALLQAQPSVDVVLLDRSMPGGAGETFVPSMRKAAPRARILMLTGQAVEPAVAMLVDGILAKPTSAERLLAAVHHAAPAAS